MRYLIALLIAMCAPNDAFEEIVFSQCVPPPQRDSAFIRKIAATIVQRYSVEEDLALEIVRAASKYERKTFPQTKDIVALIGVESSFNPRAVSGLKKDPAVGLTQIRPRTNGLKRSELYSVDGQIRHGAKILAYNYDRTRSKKLAFKSYNLGLGGAKLEHFRAAGDRYVAKLTTELAVYR